MVCKPLNDTPTTEVKCLSLKLHSPIYTSAINLWGSSVATPIFLTIQQSFYSKKPKPNSSNKWLPQCCLLRCSPHPRRSCLCSWLTSLLLTAESSRSPRPGKQKRWTGSNQENKGKEQRKAGRTLICLEVPCAAAGHPGAPKHEVEAGKHLQPLSPKSCPQIASPCLSTLLPHPSFPLLKASVW